MDGVIAAFTVDVAPETSFERPNDLLAGLRT